MTDEPPQTGDTRIFNGKLQEFDGNDWVPYQYLPSAPSGGDPKFRSVYKITDDQAADNEAGDAEADNEEDS